MPTISFRRLTERVVANLEERERRGELTPRQADQLMRHRLLPTVVEAMHQKVKEASERDDE